MGNRKLPGSECGSGFATGCGRAGLETYGFRYNYATVSPDVLALTEAEASRIYQRVGIEIQWLECPLAPKDAVQFPTCPVSPGPTKLALRILSQFMAERLRQGKPQEAERIKL